MKHLINELEAITDKTIIYLDKEDEFSIDFQVILNSEINSLVEFCNKKKLLMWIDNSEIRIHKHYFSK